MPTALLDTSIWVLYLRSGLSELKGAVREGLRRRELATCWAANAELLIGARDTQGFDELLDTLATVEDVPITPKVWEEAARLGHRLRKEKGLHFPMPDLLIAQCAIEDARVLWHAAEHFEIIRGMSRLTTRDWRVRQPGTGTSI